MENVGLWNSRNSEHYINSCGTRYGAADEGKKCGNFTTYAGGNNGVPCVLLNTVRLVGDILYGAFCITTCFVLGSSN